MKSARAGPGRRGTDTASRSAVASLAIVVLAACGGGETGVHRAHRPVTVVSGTAAPRAPESRTAAPAPRPLGPSEYRVARGDTLYSIAFRRQLDFRDLAAWNGVQGPAYAIYPGRILRLAPPVSYVGRADDDTRVPTPRASEAPVADTAVMRRTPSTAALPQPTIAAPPRSTAATGPIARSVDRPAPDAGFGPSFDPGRWEWPTRGRVVRGFGEDGSKGIDVGGTPGQVVFAAAPGKVVYSGSALQGYGELIIIKHDDQYLSAYGYNRRRLVGEGERVVAGQPIAELGVGPEQRPELHFEIRDKGRPVDPRPLLPGRG